MKVSQIFYNCQVITYVCKDGMKMKEDFFRTNLNVRCNLNNTFDTVESWPECVSSKFPFSSYNVKANKNVRLCNDIINKIVILA